MVATINAAAALRRTAASRLPVAGRGVYRLRVAGHYLLPPASRAAKWLLTSNETDNFGYRVTARNASHIASAVSLATHADPELVERYMRELEEDAELAAHLAAHGMPPLYARRIGWYAVARITKPALIVETGVHKGVGAVVLCAALRRNALEHQDGRYLGTDIDPSAGVLLSGAYAAQGQVIHGDSLATLEALAGPIGLFINDSDHSAEYERREYQAVKDKLAPGAIILGDNAHATDELMAFSRATGRRFLFVSEKPLDHWYPGAGIGISFP